MFDLTNEIYTNADKAREHPEAIHWPNGPVCPHCGNIDADVHHQYAEGEEVSTKTKKNKI